MAAGPDHLRLQPEERANLVAYLDGELTEAESRSLSTKITHSATARRELELLQKTWEVLDKLPHPQATDEFQERTLSYVRSIELKRSAWAAPLGEATAALLRLACCLLIAAAAGAAGYLGVRGLWPDPDARIVRDLSLAEHLDEYLEVGDFQVLEGLSAGSEFGRTSPR